jgi:hypothetical protein
MLFYLLSITSFGFDLSITANDLSVVGKVARLMADDDRNGQKQEGLPLVSE